VLGDDVGGGGGAAGGGGTEEGGFRGAIGGFFPMGGGGPFTEAEEAGLGMLFGADFLRLATEGINADVVAEL
jgi:hypothetical protein